MLVIFDCDGVLIDSEILVARVWAKALAGYGIDVSKENLIAEFVGKTDMDLARRFLERYQGYNLPPSDIFLSQLRQAVSEMMRNQLEVIPGVMPVLAELPYDRCVCSNSGRTRLFESLEKVGLVHYFGNNHIFSADDVAKPKPAPDIFLHAAQKMNYTPKQCVVIEDSLTGVQAAVAAGMRVIGFTGGSHVGPEKYFELIAAGAQQICASMDQLSGIIDKIFASTRR